jgi:hypothetical protein
MNSRRSSIDLPQPQYCEYCEVPFSDIEYYNRHLYHPFHLHMYDLAEQRFKNLFRRPSAEQLFSDLPPAGFIYDYSPPSPTPSRSPSDRSRSPSIDYIYLFNQDDS